jgi:glycosyltransferase involved in cell wall biosynthesis
MTVHVVDPGCAVATGHNLHLDVALARACAKRGEPCRVGYYQDATAEVRSALPEGSATFTVAVYDLAERIAREEHLPPFAPAALFADQLSGFLDQNIVPGDTIILHTCHFLHLIGCADWLMRTDHKDLTLHIILRFEPGRKVPSPACGDVEQAYRTGLAKLASASPNCPIQLQCDSDSLRALYQDLTTLPVGLIPMSIAFPSPGELASLPPPPEDCVRLGFLGEARPEKGYEFLVRVLLPVLQMHPMARFLLQVPDLRLQSDNLPAKMRARIEIIPNSLAGPEFFQTMASCTAILVPYDPVAYRYRTSHIMVEALGIGRPIIAVRGCWLSDETAAMNNKGVVFANGFNDQALARAITLFLADQTRICDEAVAHAAQWRQRHNLDGLLERLLNRA